MWPASPTFDSRWRSPSVCCEKWPVHSLAFLLWCRKHSLHLKTSSLWMGGEGGYLTPFTWNCVFFPLFSLKLQTRNSFDKNSLRTQTQENRSQHVIRGTGMAEVLFLPAGSLLRFPYAFWHSTYLTLHISTACQALTIFLVQPSSQPKQAPLTLDPRGNKPGEAEQRAQGPQLERCQTGWKDTSRDSRLQSSLPYAVFASLFTRSWQIRK